VTAREMLGLMGEVAARRMRAVPVGCVSHRQVLAAALTPSPTRMKVATAKTSANAMRPAASRISTASQLNRAMRNLLYATVQTAFASPASVRRTSSALVAIPEPCTGVVAKPSASTHRQ